MISGQIKTLHKASPVQPIRICMQDTWPEIDVSVGSQWPFPVPLMSDFAFYTQNEDAAALGNKATFKLPEDEPLPATDFYPGL